MGKYIVELSDEKGKKGSIQISLPFQKVGTNKTNSSWRVLDESFLNVRSGTCQVRGTKTNPKLPGISVAPLNLFLYFDGSWGVALWDFTDDWTFVEESGGGKVLQTWAGHCKPGEITWSLLA